MHCNPGAGKADDLHPVSRTAAPRLYSKFQRTNTFGLSIRENRQVFFKENKKNTRYMKKLSIALLALTTVHAAVTGDITALIVAFMFFVAMCGKNVYRFWIKNFNR